MLGLHVSLGFRGRTNLEALSLEGPRWRPDSPRAADMYSIDDRDAVVLFSFRFRND